VKQLGLPSDDQEILREIQIFFTKYLLNAPPEIKNRFPPILSRQDVSIFVFSTSDYVIAAFLNPTEKMRIAGLKERNIQQVATQMLLYLEE